MFLLSSIKRTTLLILLFVFLQQMMVFAQANKMTLTFNEQGKLLDGYLPRFKAGEQCNGLSARVLLPLNYLDKEEEKIIGMAKRLAKALRDDKSMLYRIILGCDNDKDGTLAALKRIILDDDITKWNLADSNANTYFPPELAKYINFIQALKRGRTNNISGDDKEIALLDDFSRNLSNLKSILYRDSTLNKDSVSNYLNMYGKKLPNDQRVKDIITFFYEIIKDSSDERVYNNSKKLDKGKISDLITKQKAWLTGLSLKKGIIFSPFKLKVSGIEISTDDACMNYESVDKEKDNCCLDKKKDYVALVFKIPPAVIRKNLAIDSFQLINVFPMKQVAINWYTKTINGLERTDLLRLKLLDDKIRASADTISLLLKTLDTLAAIDTACNGITSKQIDLQKRITDKICEYKNVLDSSVGTIADCKDCNNIILCSKQLREWVLKFMWLNGGDIKLNPFNFTLPDNLASNQANSKLSVKQKEREVADAKIRLQFLDTAIVHLRDSVMRSRGVSIKENMGKLDSLIAKRDSALATIEDKVTPKDLAEDNEKAMKSFLTVSRVNYKGWLIPFQKEKGNLYKSPDKTWIRNYYNDQAPNYIRDKFHYTYPEDENVTLLLHNISGGTGIKVVEFMNKFADSAEFTVQAGKFVADAAALYSSLGKVAPIVKEISKIVGAKQITNDLEATFAEVKLPSSLMKVGGQTSRMHPLAKNSGLETKNSIIARTKEKLNLESNLRNIDFKRIKEIGLRYSNGIIVKQVLSMNRENLYSLQKKFDTLANLVPSTDFRVPDSVVAIDGQIVLEYDNGITVKIPVNVKNSSASTKREKCIDSCYLNYIATLQSIAQSPAFIDKVLKINEDTNALYYSGRFHLKDGKAPYGISYKLLTFDTKDGNKEKLIDSSYLDVGKFVYFQSAAGLAYTPNAGFITSVDTSNGGFKMSRDEDRARLIVGLRIYPWGLYKQRNPSGLFNAPLTEKRWLHRLSIMVATGIPKPLQNLYLGGGFDVVPGLNFSVGAHFQQQNSYGIQNNQVKDRRVAYRGNVFYSLTVDPQLLVTAITSLF